MLNAGKSSLPLRVDRLNIQHEHEQAKGDSELRYNHNLSIHVSECDIRHNTDGFASTVRRGGGTRASVFSLRAARSSGTFPCRQSISMPRMFTGSIAKTDRQVDISQPANQPGRQWKCVKNRNESKLLEIHMLDPSAEFSP